MISDGDGNLVKEEANNLRLRFTNGAHTFSGGWLWCRGKKAKDLRLRLTKGARAVAPQVEGGVGQAMNSLDKGTLSRLHTFSFEQPANVEIKT